MNSSATSFTYVNSGAVVPLIQGIKKFGIKRSTKVVGLIKFTISGKNGSYPVNTSQLPLISAVILDVPNATTGLCGEALFPGPPNPTGTCTVLANGNTVRCK
jgi:hypothetical protein